MSNIVTRRVTLLGLASWLAPFIASFVFFDRSGQVLIPQPLFKSLMVVVFGGVGVALLVAAFRHVAPSPRSGLLLGLYRLVLNLGLDLLVLLPLAKMQVLSYLYDIGLRYLLIPIIAVGIGFVAGRAAARGPDV